MSWPVIYIRNLFNVGAISLTAIVLLGFAKGRSSKDTELMGLKGRIKSMHEVYEVFDTASGTDKGKVTANALLNFNEQGNITEIFAYGNNDSLVRKVTNLYMKDGQKRVCYWDDYIKHTHRKTRAWVYDRNHKLIKEIYYASGGLKSSVVEYDIQGNPCRTVHIFRNHGLIKRNETTYNYNYDTLGRVTEEDATNEDGSLLTKYIRKYDAKGNEVETDIYNTDSTLSRKINTQFDLQGNPLTVNDAYYFQGGGDLGQKRIDIYDNNGFKIEEDVYQIKADNTIVLVRSLNFENDKQGNWIRQSTYYNNKKGAVITRSLTYF